MELILSKNKKFIQDQPFFFGDHSIRIFIDANGNPWFVAKDVCKVLGLENVTKALLELDADEKKSITITKGKVGNNISKLRLVNESGLYKLIFKSRKSEAKIFTRHVTSVILPQIRKTGQYIHKRTIARDESSMRFKFMCDALTEMRTAAGKATETHHYTNEARLINFIAFGNYDAEARDSLTKPEIKRINRIQARNIILIYQGVSYNERKAMLLEIFPILISEQTVSGVDQKTEILIA